MKCLHYLLIVLIFASCDMGKKEKAAQQKELELNQKEQDLFAREQLLEQRNADLLRREQLLDSALKKTTR